MQTGAGRAQQELCSSLPELLWSQCLSSTIQSIISFADQGEEVAEPKTVFA